MPRDDAAGPLAGEAGAGTDAPVPPAARRRRPRPLGLLGRVYLLVLLTALPALGILAHNEVSLRRDLERRAEEEALRAARLVAAGLDRVFENLRGTLFALARSPSIRAGDWEACRVYLEALQREAPRAATFGVLDTSGATVCAGVPGTRPINAADRTYFREAMATGRFVVGEQITSRATGRPVLPMAVRVERADGAGPGGVIAVGLGLGWLREEFATKGLPLGTSVTLIDRAGTVLASLPDEGLEGRPAPERLRRLRRLLEAPAAGTFRTTAAEEVDGVARITGHTTLAEPPTGIVVAAGLPRDWVVAGLRERAGRGAALLALSVAAALLAAWLGGRAFVARPLAALTGTVERWRGGDLSARVDLPAGAAEFARLGAAFDAMADERERRDRELAAERERLRLILDNLPDAIVAVFPGDPVPVRNRGWFRLHRVAAPDDLPGGRRFEDVAPLFELSDGDGRRLPIEEYPMSRALRGERFEGLEFRLRRAGTGEEARWASYDGSSLRDADGRTALALVSVRDVTARREAEEQRRVLLAELDHRVKNTLAVVQALATRAAAGAPSLPAFLEAFRGRVRALAAAHDLLTSTGWRGASLRDLAGATLAGHRGGAGGGEAGDPRVAIDVPEDVQLRPEAAQSLALALNELATNAAKYGALSTPDGSVGLRAGREARDAAAGAAGELLVLDWRETGGPLVGVPPAKGFGTTLLTQLVAHQHKGRVALDWRPEGLACRIELPLAEVVQAAAEARGP